MITRTQWRTLFALAVLLASGSVFAQQPTAAGVVPTTHSGNFTDTDCPDLLGNGALGMSTSTSPVDGQAYDLGNGQSITFSYQTDPDYFDFLATIPMDYIVVKGGDSYNVFEYDPALLADQGLYAPINSSGTPAGVSHVVACFLPKPTGSKTANASWKRHVDWEIDKAVDPNVISMFDGDSHDVEYTVTVTPTVTGSYQVSGQIVVNDPWGFGWQATNAVDTIKFDNSATTFSKVWDANGGVDTMSCNKNPTAPAILICSYQFELSSEDHPFLTSATGGVNKAAITTKRGSSTYGFEVEAAFSIPGTPAMSFGDTLNVDDSMLPGNPDHVFQLGGSYVWTYAHTFTCDQDEGSHPNTATGSYASAGGPQSVSDNASVTVHCETVTVTKTADTSYSRDYAWDGDKKIVVRPQDVTAEDKDSVCSLITDGPYAGNYACDDITLILNPDGVYETVYQLNAVRSIAQEYDFLVDGQITVTWPMGTSPVFSGDPVDTLLPIDLAAAVSNCATVDNTMTCDYTATLASKDPLTNQASIERPHVCRDADGVEVACPVPGSSVYSGTAPVSFGDPNLSNFACVAVSDLFNGGAGNLPGDAMPGTGFGWLVDGQLCGSQTFYPTGVISENGMEIGSLDIEAAWAPDDFVANACLFDVPNLLTLAIEGNGSIDDLANIGVNVPLACDTGCTYTQGYWKTHSKYGPAPYDATWEAIGEDTLFFASGQTWYTVFWTPPQKGNAYYILAHQYMAARLNVEAGASVPPDVQSALDEATAWFTGRSTAAPKGAARNTAIALAGILAAYNEGALGPGHCSISPRIAD